VRLSSYNHIALKSKRTESLFYSKIGLWGGFPPAPFLLAIAALAQTQFL